MNNKTPLGAKLAKWLGNKISLEVQTSVDFALLFIISNQPSHTDYTLEPRHFHWSLCISLLPTSSIVLIRRALIRNWNLSIKKVMMTKVPCILPARTFRHLVWGKKKVKTKLTAVVSEPVKVVIKKVHKLNKLISFKYLLHKY